MSDTSAFLFWSDATGATRRTRIGLRPVTLGSGPMCVVALPEQDAGTVHAVVERERDGHVARRLSRRLPLLVDGQPVDTHALRHGDRLGLGSAEVVYLEPVEIAPQTLRLSIRREGEDQAIEVELPHALTVIGRSEGQLLIDDASVSRHHLEIENFGEGLRWARDLDSTNGSELNGAPLAYRRPLRPGDVLKAGRIEMTVLEGGLPPEGVTEFEPRHVQFDQDHAMA